MKTSEKRQMAILALMRHKDSQLSDYKKLVIIQYTNKQDLPAIAVFGRQGAKPLSHYYFRTLDDRSKFLQETKDRQDQVIASEERQKVLYEQDKAKYVPGAILYSSWGYEQTNVDFYLITKRTPNAVWLVEIGSTTKETGFMSGETVPDKNVIKSDKPFMRRFNKWGSLSISSYQGLALYNGQPKYCSWYA